MPVSVQNHTNFPPECFGDSWCDNGNVKSQLDSPIDWTLIFSVDQFLLSSHRESNSKQSQFQHLAAVFLLILRGQFLKVWDLPQEAIHMHSWTS